MARKYDAIVVGAGPAGLVAARALGEDGFNVALLESKQDITKLTRACAQTLDSPNEYMHNELFRCNVRDKRLSFPAHGFSVKYDGPYKNVYGTYVYSPGGNMVQLGIPEEQKKKGEYGVTIPVPDKEILFRCLLEEARAFNVEVFAGVQVQRVVTLPDGVRAEGNGRSFEGCYLIAADGLNSRIAEMMGFNRDRTYYGNLRAVVHYMSGLDLPNTDVSYHIYGFPPGGPAQLFIFPRPAQQEEYIFGLATMHPAVDLQEATDYFMRKAFCAQWFRNAKIVRSFSAVCNNRTPVFEPYRDRVLLTGDAAFTQEMEITGAIIWGWQAGHAIALALQEERLGLPVTAITRYLKKWKEEHIDQHSYDIMMKNWAIPYVLTDPSEIDYLFSLIKEPLPPSSNPYRMGEYLMQALQKAVPQIQRERPEILQKLSKMFSPATEIFAPVAKISKPV